MNRRRIQAWEGWSQRPEFCCRVVAWLLLSLLFLAPVACPAQAAPGKAAAPPSKPAITQQQADAFFLRLEAVMKFVSEDSKLPIKNPVKHQLSNRDQVEKNLRESIAKDQDARRLERAEMVLKKFRFVPQDFALGSFLVEMTRDQVAGYYSPKTKTIYMMDWMELDKQLPVMAHEMTHALQDQSFDLEQWLKPPKPETAGAKGRDQKSNKSSDDSRPPTPAEMLVEYEMDEQATARQAVAEGQGMAVMLDYALSPSHHTILDSPSYLETVKEGMDRGSPVLNRAPLYLKESLVFPYTYGLDFVRDVQFYSGREAAYAGAMRDPPRNTHEVMHPKIYLAGEHVEPMRLPRLEPLLEGGPVRYEAYDAGSMGEFDVHVLLAQFADEKTADKLSPEWRGGIYFALCAKTPPGDAVAAESKPLKADASDKTGAAMHHQKTPDTHDLALLYWSRWSSPESAKKFAAAYSAALPARYRSARSDPLAGSGGPARWMTMTDEGLVLVEQRGAYVLALESFDDATTLRLRDAIFASAAGAPSTVK